MVNTYVEGETGRKFVGSSKGRILCPKYFDESSELTHPSIPWVIIELLRPISSYTPLNASRPRIHEIELSPPLFTTKVRLA